MVISDLAELPRTQEIAVIINARTKHVATLALLSALRYARVPTVVIDCESRDGSYEWFESLLGQHDFHLMRAKLHPHGQTLDWVFKRIRSERVLLIDSDAEVLNDQMISGMRAMLDSSEQLYGSGYLHPAQWLEYHYWSGFPLAPGIGYYMTRPWIPFTLLLTEPIRKALAAGQSFMPRLVRNEAPRFPLISRLLWARFQFPYFRTRRLAWLDRIRRSYGGEFPAYVSYDTGADIHEFMIEKSGLVFEGVSAESVPWSVTHFSGITRGILYEGASDDAYKINKAHPIVLERLRNLYGIDISTTTAPEF